MIYDNQLIMTGKINDVGAPIVENYDNSFRRGLEFSVGSYFFKIIDWNANISLSQNKITNFTEYVDNWDYWNDPDNQPLQISNFLGTTDIAFSPSIVANNTIYVKMTKNFSFEFNSQYVGRQFIDNTSSVDRSLKPYFTNDFGFRSSFTTKTIKEILFTLKVNNVFNQMYETNAWVYSYYYENQRSELNGYFPQVGINFFANLSFKF
jgi:iron complex outermembrane receptor protein